MRYHNILLIDDDVEDHEIFLTAVQFISKDIRCTTMTNAKEALTKLGKAEISPEVIFLDLNMPIMSGQEFLTKIKQQEKIKEIPVIIFSTSSNSTTIELTKELGAIDFITKPNKFDELIDVLKNLK